DILHKPQQCQAAFCVAIDDVREGWVFTEEETEVVATDATVSVFTVGIGPGPFVVKAQDVAVVVQRLAEVADGKVDVGFDEFLGEAGHWGDRVVTKLRKVAEADADADAVVSAWPNVLVNICWGLSQ